MPGVIPVYLKKNIIEQLSIKTYMCCGYYCNSSRIGFGRKLSRLIFTVFI